MKKKQEKVINPKVSVYLFSKENPKGEIFKFVGGTESEEYKAMLEKGYYDTPARLNLPKDDNVGITVEQAENANPMHLKIMLEKIGFIVLTPEQLKAEVNKLVGTHIDIKQFTNEALIEEAERRGLKEGSNLDDISDFEEEEEEDKDPISGIINTSAIDNELMDQFLSNPKSLTREEHIILGKQVGAKLRINFGEDTMITKIKQALSAK